MLLSQHSEWQFHMQLHRTYPGPRRLLDRNLKSQEFPLGLLAKNQTWGRPNYFREYRKSICDILQEKNKSQRSKTIKFGDWGWGEQDDKIYRFGVVREKWSRIRDERVHSSRNSVDWLVGLRLLCIWEDSIETMRLLRILRW